MGFMLFFNIFPKYFGKFSDQVNIFANIFCKYSGIVFVKSVGLVAVDIKYGDQFGCAKYRQHNF